VASLPPFLETLVRRDPAFARLVVDVREQALYTPGALDVKTKLLIAFALDAAGGREDGARILLGRAREVGATDEEITEVLRVLYSVGGLQNLSLPLQLVEPDPA
jgi:alkylhydroperoxidase/carboxymuconolactone decarboxylase family protein YurZ